MCTVSDEIREAIIACDAEGRWPESGKWWPFGTRAFMAALGIPKGNAVNRIIIDVQHGKFAQVYVTMGGSAENPDALMAMLNSLPPEAIVEIGADVVARREPKRPPEAATLIDDDRVVAYAPEGGTFDA